MVGRNALLRVRCGTARRVPGGHVQVEAPLLRLPLVQRDAPEVFVTLLPRRHRQGSPQTPARPDADRHQGESENRPTYCIAVLAVTSPAGSVRRGWT